jgi:hypothetical protein
MIFTQGIPRVCAFGGNSNFSIVALGDVAPNRTLFMVAIFWLACTAFGALRCGLVQLGFVWQAPEQKWLIVYLIVDPAVAENPRKQL